MCDVVERKCPWLLPHVGCLVRPSPNITRLPCSTISSKPPSPGRPLVSDWYTVCMFLSLSPVRRSPTRHVRSVRRPPHHTRDDGARAARIIRCRSVPHRRPHGRGPAGGRARVPAHAAGRARGGVLKITPPAHRHAAPWGSTAWRYAYRVRQYSWWRCVRQYRWYGTCWQYGWRGRYRGRGGWWGDGRGRTPNTGPEQHADPP